MSTFFLSKPPAPASITKEEILEATLKDKGLVKLMKMIKNSRYSREDDVKHFSQVFKELSVTNEGLILRDTQLSIPEALTHKMVDLAHEGHSGRVKIKQLLRSKVRT